MVFTFGRLLFFIFLYFSLHQLSLKTFVLSPGSRNLGLRVSLLFTNEEEKNVTVSARLYHSQKNMSVLSNRGDLITNKDSTPCEDHLADK